MPHSLRKIGQIVTLCGVLLYAGVLLYSLAYATHTTTTHSADGRELTIVFDPLPVWFSFAPLVTTSLGIVLWWIGQRRSRRDELRFSQ